jgi:hypothetical protein
MSAHDEERIKYLLRQAVPPVEAESAAPAHDLWPAVLRRLDAHTAAQPRSKWVWFDWALAAGLAVVTLSFPASIPLLLYYL